MFRKMRRFKQEMSESRVAAVLEKSTAGVLSLTGDDGYPYGVPLSHTYKDGKLYFHCAKTGHKIDAIEKNEKACFTVIDSDEVIPSDFTTHFRSVIAFGRIKIIDNKQEMWKLLEDIVDKFSTDFKESGEKAIEDDINNVLILCMEIDHLSGKESRQIADESI